MRGEHDDHRTAVTGGPIARGATAPDRADQADAGASSFAQVSPLQRIWRDANTAGRHALAGPLVNQEVYGKALLGIPYEGNITPLI